MSVLDAALDALPRATYTTHAATHLDDYLTAELARVIRDYSRPVHGHTTAHVRAHIHALTAPEGAGQ